MGADEASADETGSAALSEEESGTNEQFAVKVNTDFGFGNTVVDLIEIECLTNFDLGGRGLLRC